MENPKRLYFTYGTSEKMPFKGGWSIAEGKSYEECLALYKLVHPQEDPDCICCAFMYTEEEFKKTIMYKEGNLGHKTWEIIRLDITRKEQEVQC